MNDKYDNYSVLMSVYYKEKAEYLESAMNSVWNQTIPTNDFVLVCDGFLTPELDAVIETMSIAHSELNVIRIRENGGLGNALNIGIKHCKNELVARMDSDDYSLADRFEKQLTYMKNNPTVNVLGGQIVEFDLTLKNKLAARIVPTTMNDIVKVMPYRNAMNHVTVMYKKTAVVNAGNYMDCPFFEDYYLWCRMLKMGYKFSNIDSVLVNVRTGNDMYKRRGGKEYNKAIVEFQKKILELGFTNMVQCYINVAIRLIVANMPNFFRGLLYRTKLRTNA